MSDGMCLMITASEYNELNKRIEELEEALDNACQELEGYDYQANLKPGHYDTDDYIKAKEWKERFLKDD